MKRLLGVFFLINFLIAGAAAADTAPVLNAGPDFKAVEILQLPNLGPFFTFDFEGNYIFARPAGAASQIVKISPSGETAVLAERISQPILGLSFHDGQVYVVFRGRIDVLNRGVVSDIVTGLPASGDFPNTPVVFGKDGKMYFGVGTATNSGIVGQDNQWLRSNPSVHDLICPGFRQNLVNAETDNFLTAKKDDKASTGAFMPFNTPVSTETPTGSDKCSGAIMQAGPDGSGLRIYATGFHNPKGISFDSAGKAYALDTGMENRGVRPVADGRDSLFAIEENSWHGWPDYNAGKRLDEPLIKDAPDPVVPQATFDSGHLSQFAVSDFEPNTGLAMYDENKIVSFALSSGSLSDFAAVAEGYKINQIKFGPDKNLYVLVSDGKQSSLWKIESTRHPVVTAATTPAARSLPLAWSISLSVMAVGLIGTYFVYRNRQQQIL